MAVKDRDGEYKLLSGNEVGLLLLNYFCSQRVKYGKMPDASVMVNNIVAMELGERIAMNYGVKTINVLISFKFIIEQVDYFEKKGKENSYAFGFEESYGYLSGFYVSDKDGVNGAYMICEMFSFYETKLKTYISICVDGINSANLIENTMVEDLKFYFEK